jgi:hypothetical protein
VDRQRHQRGILNNAGTWTGSVTNAGTFTTTGTLAGALTNFGATNAQGTITGAIANNAGALNVTGALTIGGAIDNAAGATLNAIGGARTITAPGALAFTNEGTINGALNVTASGILNWTIAANTVSQVNGTLVMTGANGSSLANSGTLSMVNGVTTDSVTLKTAAAGSTFNYAGNAAKLNVDINLSNAAVGASPVGTADQLKLLNGTPSGTTTVTFTQVNAANAATFVAKPIPVVSWSNGQVPPATFTAAGLPPSNQLLTFDFQQFNNQPADATNKCGGVGGTANCFAVVTGINSNAIAQTSAAISGAIASIDSAFHQPASALVASASNSDPDHWTGGVWIRANAGESTVTSSGTAFVPNTGPVTVAVKTRTIFAGFQTGIDSGVLNIGSSGWNAHLGITAGEVTADATEQLGSGNKVHFDVPFVGVYGVATHGNLFTDFMLRRDFYDLRVTNPAAGEVNTGMHGDATNFNSSLGVNIPIAGTQFFMEPSVSISYTRSTFDLLPVFGGAGPGSSLAFGPLYSFLGRAGVRVGTLPIMVSDNLVITPFVTYSIWHEFAGSARSVFSLADNTGGFTQIPVLSTRVDSFNQVGLGFSWQIPRSGWVGFVRGDARFGDNLDGFGGVTGVRYTFN